MLSEHFYFIKIVQYKYGLNAQTKEEERISIGNC